jgi:hypothetical protein
MIISMKTIATLVTHLLASELLKDAGICITVSAETSVIDWNKYKKLQLIHVTA